MSTNEPVPTAPLGAEAAPAKDETAKGCLLLSLLLIVMVAASVGLIIVFGRG